LYFVVLRGWREAFGGGDPAARWLSLVASLAAIALLYDAVRLTFRSRSAGLWAAALAAVAEPQVGHGSIVRGYALLLSFGTLAWWALARVQATDDAPGDAGQARRHRTFAYHATLAAAVAAMLLTHYFAVGAAAALLAYALIGLRGGTRVRATAAIAAGGIVWVAAWGPTLYRHARHFSGADSTTDFLRRPPSGAPRIFDTLSDTLAAPLRLLFELPQRTTAWAWLAGLLCLALLAHAAVRRRREFLLPALWLVGTLGFVAALDLFRSTRLLHEARYLLLGAPALYAFLAGAVPRRQAGAEPVTRALRHALPGVIVLACLARGIASASRAPELDWRPLAEFLDDPARANDVIVFSREGQADWYTGYQVMAYGHASDLPPGRPVALLDLPGADALVADVAKRGRCWIVHLSAEPLPFGQVVPPGFEAVPAGVPDFPPVVWELRPASRRLLAGFDLSGPAS
jgi:hypothetical protein